MTHPGILAVWTDFLGKREFLHNTPGQWVALAVVLLGSFVVGKLASVILDHHGRKLKEQKRLELFGLVLQTLAGPVALVALAAGLYTASTFMNLEFVSVVTREVPRDDGEVTIETIPQTTDLLPFWLNVCKTIAVIAGAWFIFRLVDVVEFFLLRWTAKTRTALDDQMVPLLRKTLRVIVVIMAGLFIAQNVFNWDIAALIAGLGIGGIALALAAQDALSNFFGSITIFADRPFTLGDWVVINDHEGIIEEVGFRSTRVRTFFGHLVTIPNSTVSSSAVDNVSARPYIRRNLNVTVTYDTPPEKVQRGMEILREMLDARSESFPQDRPAKVLFSDFNAASLNILVVYWYTPPDWWDYQAFNNDFNLELLRRFNDEGIEFAFPTQTLYLKQDSDFQADVRLTGETHKGE